ncbi:MAG TPA: YdbL family protein [Gallionella sp.]|nr:YdbL family protein [Gallionella sp.]
MKNVFGFIVSLFALVFALNASAADLDINTPGVNAIKQSMQARHAQLAPLYASGAVGLTSDGLVTLRDADAVPLAQRQSANALVAAENRDRNALYAEIANANGHPEWEGEIRSTFAQRWIQRAQPGWWVQSGGGWSQK